MKNSLFNAISNISQSIYDGYVEANAKFRARGGLKTVIIRRELGQCCDWCSQLAGIYDYSDAPDDIFARHDNCRCMVTVKTEKGTYQDVWSKKEYNTQREARIARSQGIEEDSEFWKKNNQAKRQAKADGKHCFDVTEEWLRRSGRGSVVKHEKGEMYIDNQKIIIDGRVNKYKPSPRESHVANIIANKLGVRVEINPKINNPKGFPLSDYFINGVRYDLKSSEGSSKHTIYNIIKGREKQAHSFVVDIGHDTIDLDETIRQIQEDVFWSKHTKFVETIILVDKDDNIRVFERL